MGPAVALTAEAKSKPAAAQAGPATQRRPPPPRNRPSQSAGLVRRCACGGVTGPTGECAACRAKRLAGTGSLRVAASTDAAEVDAQRVGSRFGTQPKAGPIAGQQGGRPAGFAPAAVDRVLDSPGRPLPTSARMPMEQYFDRDFSAVRVHTDAASGASARALGARAYSVGDHVVFGAGAFAPETPSGMRLLAHELTHVAQPRAGGAQGQFVHRQVTDEDPLAAQTGDIDDDAQDGDTAVDTSGDGDVETGRGTGAEYASLDSDAPGVTPTQTGAARWITHIDVNLATQVLVLTWSDGTTSAAHNVSTGRGRCGTAPADPCATQGEVNCTPPGDFTVSSKGNAGTTNSHGDAMSWYVGFIDSRGIGIHDSQPVTAGVPRSHGCVRVGDTAADNAFARLINQNTRTGRTTVHIHGKAPTRPWPCPRR